MLMCAQYSFSLASALSETRTFAGHPVDHFLPPAWWPWFLLLEQSVWEGGYVIWRSRLWDMWTAGISSFQAMDQHQRCLCTANAATNCQSRVSLIVYTIYPRVYHTLNNSASSNGLHMVYCLVKQCAPSIRLCMPVFIALQLACSEVESIPLLWNKSCISCLLRRMAEGHPSRPTSTAVSQCSSSYHH